MNLNFLKLKFCNRKEGGPTQTFLTKYKIATGLSTSFTLILDFSIVPFLNKLTLILNFSIVPFLNKL